MSPVKVAVVAAGVVAAVPFLLGAGLIVGLAIEARDRRRNQAALAKKATR